MSEQRRWTFVVIPDLFRSFGPESSHIKSETFDVEARVESVEAAYQVINVVMLETGSRPAFLLLGWRTYLELCLVVHRNGFDHVSEFRGVPVIVDPSVERCAKAILHRRFIGRPENAKIQNEVRA